MARDATADRRRRLKNERSLIRKDVKVYLKRRAFIGIVACNDLSSSMLCPRLGDCWCDFDDNDVKCRAGDTDREARRPETQSALLFLLEQSANVLPTLPVRKLVECADQSISFCRLPRAAFKLRFMSSGREERWRPATGVV